MRKVWSAPLLVAGVVLTASAPAAHAFFHLWVVDEVYSNADGSVQFVELNTTQNDQDLLGTHSLEFKQGDNVIATAPFGTDLFTTFTKDHSLLVATPGFLAVAGIEPDYEMPAQTIPVAQVDSVKVSDAPASVFAFTAGTIPLDGVNSLNRTGGIAAATPTNFAGQTGTIPEPTAALEGVAALATLFGFSRRAAPRAR